MVAEYRQRCYAIKRVSIACAAHGDHYVLPDVQFPQCVTDSGYAHNQSGWQRAGVGDNIILYTEHPPVDISTVPPGQLYDILSVVDWMGNIGGGYTLYYSDYQYYAPLVPISSEVDASVWGNRQERAAAQTSTPMLASQGELQWYDTVSHTSGVWPDPPLYFLAGEGLKKWGYGGWDIYNGAVLYGWYEYHEHYGWRSYSRESDTLPDDVLTNPARINPWCKAVYDITYYQDVYYYTQYERISVRGGIAPILGAMLAIGAGAMLGYVPPKKPRG